MPTKIRWLCSIAFLALLPLHATTAAMEKGETQEESTDDKTQKPETTTSNEKSGETDAPDLGRLLELNGAAIFGGRVKVRGEQLEITFDANGQMRRGFTGRGIHDADSDLLKGSNRKFSQHGEQKGRGRGR